MNSIAQAKLLALIPLNNLLTRRNNMKQLSLKSTLSIAAAVGLVGMSEVANAHSAFLCQTYAQDGKTISLKYEAPENIDLLNLGDQGNFEGQIGLRINGTVPFIFDVKSSTLNRIGRPRINLTHKNFHYKTEMTITIQSYADGSSSFVGSYIAHKESFPIFNCNFVK